MWDKYRNESINDFTQRLKAAELDLSWIVSLKVSPAALFDLAHESETDDIASDLNLLKNNYMDVPDNLRSFLATFRTQLWTLMSEISIPNDLGLFQYQRWPYLIHPLGINSKQEIESFVADRGARIVERKHIQWDIHLLAKIYGGQQWYPSMRELVFHRYQEKYQVAEIGWFEINNKCGITLASLARKLQRHLRPILPAIEESLPDQRFPGVLRAFHTPDLRNMFIHELVLKEARIV